MTVVGLYTHGKYYDIFQYMKKHKKKWYIDNAGTLWYIKDIEEIINLINTELEKQA